MGAAAVRVVARGRGAVARAGARRALPGRAARHGLLAAARPGRRPPRARHHRYTPPSPLPLGSNS